MRSIGLGLDLRWHCPEGGGYAFRLCKKAGKGSCAAEADFLKLPYLTFVKTELRWSDGTTEEINGTYITEVSGISLFFSVYEPCPLYYLELLVVYDGCMGERVILRCFPQGTYPEGSTWAMNPLPGLSLARHALRCVWRYPALVSGA
jgi:hypothetical protein